MSKYYISANQLAEFYSATNSSKRRIINQQLNPNKLLIPWYQSAKSSIKKYLKNIDNTLPIEKGIELLLNKVPQNSRQNIDRRVSIEALNQLKSFAFPKLLRDIDFEIIQPTTKHISFNNVDIKVSPDVVLKGYYNGMVVYGAVKIHICKSKPFSLEQGNLVSTLIYKYLTKEVARKDEMVLPELCLCLDIFANRITQASVYNRSQVLAIKTICEQLKSLWAA